MDGGPAHYDLHLQADAALVLRPSPTLTHFAALSHGATGIAVGLLERAAVNSIATATGAAARPLVYPLP